MITVVRWPLTMAAPRHRALTSHDHYLANLHPPHHFFACQSVLHLDTMTFHSSAPVRMLGHTFIEHTLERPWTPEQPDDTFELFAREIIPDGGENYPYMVYLQGGPGFPSPRPTAISGWMQEALRTHRILLLDQRGTGRSHRIDAASPEADRTVERLRCLRQEFIVEDAEALRRALGVEQWALFGQSFGGFCITTYLSLYPESITEAFLTGGLPSLEASADDIYRTTFAKLRYRHDQFYAQVPFAQQRIREIAHHLDQSAELLPTGERLSSRRFRMLGINLGRGTGFATLGYLLESPFVQHRGEKRLTREFLAAVGEHLSYERGPLYAAIHESIYGGIGGQQVTNWSAHRIREEIPGFAEAADPRSLEPYYLTGEHIFPWQFEEDPALHSFQQAAQQLAEHTWQQSPYDAQVLATAPAVAAEVYLDDIFVPFEYSMHTAHSFADARVDVTNFFQHDGIGHDGSGIYQRLLAKLRDH